MRILLVEDDDRIAEPLAEDLRHQNHAVDIAYDGLAGWKFAQAADYDVILLDWMLPKLDGVQLCQRLCQNGCQAYILLLTADQISGEQTIKTHLTNLRRKLKQAGCQQDIIETVYGVGYRLGNS